jgi:hypothetical protein
MPAPKGCFGLNLPARFFTVLLWVLAAKQRVSIAPFPPKNQPLPANSGLILGAGAAQGAFYQENSGRKVEFSSMQNGQYQTQFDDRSLI